MREKTKTKWKKLIEKVKKLSTIRYEKLTYLDERQR